MLLHDNYIPFFVNLQAVVVIHYKVKCTNCIFCVECISIMADSDKTLIGDGNLSNNNRKSSAPNIIPPSTGTMHPDTHPTHHVAMSETSALKRKQTSFQITSVTVKGSRLSTDGGEDSADDLDESHTEDASSDILDCSRTTDVDNDQLPEECSNVNNDESSVHAPSIPVKCRTELPIKKDAQKNEINKFPSESSKDDKPSAPSEKNQSQHVVNPPALPDQWQHRFRVVKIVSSEPFKRGRWLCMDFMDPPAPAVEMKPEVSESASSSGTQIIPSTCFSDAVPTDRVAHIYEISPSDAYPGSISVAVGPDQIQQPMYGIFLPVNNGQYPFISGVNTTAVAVPEESKRSEPPPPATSTTRTIQQQSQLFTASQTTTFSEAQPQFPCQQTQVATTTASQKPVQPATTIQACPQHQSQTSVKASTPATTLQQPAVSAPVIPTATPVTTTTQSAIPPQSQVTQESQQTMQPRAQPPVVPQSNTVPTSTSQTVSMPTSTPTVISSTTQMGDLSQTVVSVANAPVPAVSSVSVAQTSSVGTQATAAVSDIPEVTSAPSVKKQEPAAVPSQVIPNHVEVKELGTPPSSTPQLSQEISTEVPAVKSDINGEDPERFVLYLLSECAFTFFFLSFI